MSDSKWRREERVKEDKKQAQFTKTGAITDVKADKTTYQARMEREQEQWAKEEGYI